MKKILILCGLAITMILSSVLPYNYLPTNEVQASVFDGKGLRDGIGKVKEHIKGTGVTIFDSLIIVILGLVRAILPYVGLFAFVGLIYSGFLYVTAFADDQTEKAKNIFKWSAFGILIIFIAYAFVATIINVGNK